MIIEIMTAKQKLKEITNKSKWYDGVFAEGTAWSYKSRLLSGHMSNDKIREILFKLGYKPKQEEVW